MERYLSFSEVKPIIENTKNSFLHEECATCECYLGFVTHLELLSDPSSQQYLEEEKPAKKHTHSCLGCDPCPPGDHYAKFIRENQ